MIDSTDNELVTKVKLHQCNQSLKTLIERHSPLCFDIFKKYNKILQERGIVYAPDFLINAGGIINVYAEIAHYDKAEAMRRTENIYNTTLEIFDYAVKNSLTPQKAAMAIAEE